MADATWPLKRACSLLAMELVRAQYRNRGQLGSQYVRDIRYESEALLKTAAMPGAEASFRGTFPLLSREIAPDGDGIE